MTEFYNCLIFLQFFTASFTIVLTPQGYARERIFSMKEQLYTIPLNDAVNAQDECPFCFIHRSIEQDLLDFVLGSGSSYMEAHAARRQTDNKPRTNRQSRLLPVSFSENVRLRQYSGQCLDLKDPLPAHDPGNAAGICLLPPRQKLSPG